MQDFSPAEAKAILTAHQATARPLRIELPSYEAIALYGAIAVAQRHPAMQATVGSRGALVYLERFAGDLRKQIAQGDTKVEAVLKRSFDRDQIPEVRTLETLRQALHDPQKIRDAMAVLKIGVDKGDPPEQSFAIAIGSFLGDVFGIHEPLNIPMQTNHGDTEGTEDSQVGPDR